MTTVCFLISLVDGENWLRVPLLLRFILRLVAVKAIWPEQNTHYRFHPTIIPQQISIILWTEVLERNQVNLSINTVSIPPSSQINHFYLLDFDGPGLVQLFFQLNLLWWLLIWHNAEPLHILLLLIQVFVVDQWLHISCLQFAHMDCQFNS